MKKYLSIICLAISSTCFGLSGHVGATLGGSTFLNQDAKNFYQNDKSWFTTFGAEAGFVSECYCFGLDFAWHYLNPTGESVTDGLDKAPYTYNIDSKLHVLSMFISTECDIGCGSIFRLGIGPALGYNKLNYKPILVGNNPNATNPNPTDVTKWTWGFSAKANLNFECGCFYLGPFAQYTWLRFDFKQGDLTASITEAAKRASAENFLLKAANCDHFTLGAELGMYF